MSESQDCIHVKNPYGIGCFCTHDAKFARAILHFGFRKGTPIPVDKTSGTRIAVDDLCPACVSMSNGLIAIPILRMQEAIIARDTLRKQARITEAERKAGEVGALCRQLHESNALRVHQGETCSISESATSKI